MSPILMPCGVVTSFSDNLVIHKHELSFKTFIDLQYLTKTTDTTMKSVKRVLNPNIVMITPLA